MRLSDIPEVSQLHLRTLPGVVANIGIPYLTALYTHLVQLRALHVALVAQEQSHIVGVITATTDLYKTQDSLSRIFVRPAVLAALCMAVLKRRVTISDLLKRFIKERHFRVRFKSPYPTILTFFVGTPHQHKGIGKQLLIALNEALPRQITLYVDTEKANVHAQDWYSAHGFAKITDIDTNVVYRQQHLH